MPPRFRSRLLALAFAASAVACTAPAANAALDGPTPVKHERRHGPPSRAQRAAKVALEAVGVPYRWGGASPTSGFDCSGLVYWAYSRVGVPVPHSSYALYATGRSVRRSRMRPGDVLFFTGLGHVGIYL